MTNDVKSVDNLEPSPLGYLSFFSHRRHPSIPEVFFLHVLFVSAALVHVNVLVVCVCSIYIPDVC